MRAVWIAMSLTCACIAAAQSEIRSSDGQGRETVVYQSGRMLVNVEQGEHQQAHHGPELHAFVAAHAGLHGGNFVLFRGTDGAIHDLADAEAVAELQSIYAPMRALSEKQEASDVPQHELSEKQRQLSAKMRAASSPQEMTFIGEQQSEIGRQQSAIGKQQSEIGEQQSEVGRRFQAQLTKDIAVCLAANTCPVIAN